MAGLIWRRWSALWLLLGSVLVPLFLEVFSRGSILRFAAQPLRWGWFALLGLEIVRRGWLSGRAAAIALILVALPLAGSTLYDLLVGPTVHPGWYLGLEWWQRGLYPWLDLLPYGLINERPSYLWIASVWTLAEGLILAVILLRTPVRVTADRQR